MVGNQCFERWKKLGCKLRRKGFASSGGRRSVEYAAVVFFAEFVFYRIFVMIRNNTTYFKNENPDSMIRISRFFLPFLCCLTAPALAGTQTRWEVVPDSTAIVWNVREGDSHRDHIEMSGLRISAVLRYGVGADGSFRFERSIVWPMLRTIPNNTHGSLMRRFAWDVPLMLSVNENCLQQEKVRRIVLDGTMTVESDWTAVKGSLSLTRVLFPSVDEAAFCEKYILKNTGEKPLYVEIPRARSVIRTAPAKGVEGSYELVAEICGDTALMLAPRAEVAFGAFFSGRRSGDEALALNADAECAKRRALVAEWQRNLVLDTPDPVIDAMFAFAKIRAAESIYDTKGGLMHGPGGERFYAAIWANDQAEYINPFFPFLGYDRGNRSALCSFGYFARYMNPDYRPIPSSIIAEGTDIWNGAGDRGDAAMIAYGAARYALARGDAAEAAEVWPLVEWCLEYCRRRLTGDGVVASDSDELEGRFPAGDANLCTSSLYYDALLSAAMLGRELHKPARQLAAYERQAAALRKNIDRHFGGMVEGFDTYRYYTGNDRLRAWICIPLTVGIDERKEATVEALFSPKLWTENGLLTRSGDKTFWDRSTLYALRGVYASGETEKATGYLSYYSGVRLLGDHVPYAIEAWPEGSQRHLSAESGLYCRILTEGVFGIRPTGFRSFTLTPRLPAAWDRMNLRNVRAFGSAFDIEVRRAAKGMEVAVTQDGREVVRKRLRAGQSLGVTLGNALHLSPEASLSLGVWFARITGLSMFLAYTGAFFTLCYSPLKAIIQGTPKALWPEPMTRLNAMGMPSIAMWMQCGLVTIFILLVSFGGGTASAFFNKLTLMANVSMTLPYLFLALAFPFFKARQDLDRPFVIFKTRMSAMIATVVVVLVVTFANVFTIIQPVVEAGDWDSTLWMIGGPVFFSLLAMAIYQNYCSRMANKPELALD